MSHIGHLAEKEVPTQSYFFVDPLSRGQSIPFAFSSLSLIHFSALFEASHGITNSNLH